MAGQAHGCPDQENKFLRTIPMQLRALSGCEMRLRNSRHGSPGGLCSSLDPFVSFWDEIATMWILSRFTAIVTNPLTESIAL
jgi:hypothetical protein